MGPKKYSDAAIRLCDSELIEKQILVALSDESKVACIFDKEDLRDVICALGSARGSHNHKCLQHDLRQLFVAAFGEQPLDIMNLHELPPLSEEELMALNNIPEDFIESMWAEEGPRE